MKKSVKEMLAICSLVMFCSVFMGNTLLISNAEAVPYRPAEKTTTTTPAAVDWGSNNFQAKGIGTTTSKAKKTTTTAKSGTSSSSKGNTDLEISALKAKAATGKMTQAEYDRLGNLGLNMSQFNVVITDAKSEDKPAVQEVKATEATTTVDGGGTYTAPVGGAYCANTKNVFQTIACKIVTTLDDLRMIIYVIAGFGLIAFAFSAIFGKISWKHLAQIGFGLFLVSMMAPFISYFTGPGGGYKYYKMPYGDYLPYGDFSKEFAKVGVSGSSTEQEDCKKTSLGEANEAGMHDGGCLDEVVITAAPKGSWSLKDLKGTVQSAIKTAQAAHSAVKATTSAIKEVKAQATLISGAIKNGGGGIDGLLNIAGTVANAGAALGQTGYTLGKNLQYNAATAANSYQDAFLTNEERAYNEKERAAGRQTNKLAETVSDVRSGIVKKGENFYDAKGNKILVKANDQGQFVDASGKVLGDKVDSDGNLVTASKFSNLVDKAEKGREYAMKGGAGLTSASNDSQNMNNMVGGIGGGFLGNLAGLVTLGASATGNLVDVNSQIQNNEIAKKQAQATQAASISGVKTNVTDKKGNQTIQYNDGTTEKKNKDGSTSIKFPDGSSQTVNASGMVQTSDGKGNTVTVHPDGTVAKSNADGTKETTYKDGSKKEYTKDGGYVAYDKKGNSTGTYDSDGGLISSAPSQATTKASSSNTTASAAKTTTTSTASASTSAAPAFKASSAVVTTVKSGTSTITKFEDGSFKEDKANGTSYVSKKDGTGVSYGKDGKATAEYKNGAITAMYLKSGEKAPVTEESGYKVVRNSKGEIQAVYGSSGAAVSQSEAVKAGIKGAESFK